ncbi:hypothetical protein HKX32_19980, partial [Sulfitobacter sp. KE42]
MTTKENLQNIASLGYDMSVDECLLAFPDELESDKQSDLKEDGRLKNDPEFQRYVREHLWVNRREHAERQWPWHTNVFEFIRETYAQWLGNGLLQSDLRELDPKLYAQLHKTLSAIPDKEERKDTINALPLPKERSDEALRYLADSEEDPELARQRQK